MIKIQIKSIWGAVLFEYEKENNTMKDTLIEAVKKGADLRGADLRGANLSGADLRCADLRGAYLSNADLSNANLSGADLRCAYLRNADLSNANLSNADLRCAYLRNADLSNANLSGAKEIPFVPFACPSDGSFIGWKKVSDHLIMLEIPQDAKRCSSTSQKCRCDKAKVLGITNLKTDSSVSEITNSSYSPAITYTVGEMVYPDSFDDNRWEECSHGIHFFINKQDAINY